MLKLIKIACLILGAFLVVSIAAALFSILSVESDVKDFHASFKPGAPITSFKVPAGTRTISISFKQAADAGEPCLQLMVRNDRLMSFEPKPWAKTLSDRNQLAAEIAALRPEIDRCSVMEWTLQGSTPYRGTVRVHYRDGLVDRLDEPFFWD